MTKSFAFDCPHDALVALAERLAVVDLDRPSVAEPGRVLASDVVADRDSPAADVSAMDGYAVRMADLETNDEVAVVAQSVCGSPPPEMPTEGVLRIFTGAIVPQGCEAVVKREHTIESADRVQFTEAARENDRGANIRRAGENSTAGSVVLRRGAKITGATMATMANFGGGHADVYRRVRLSLITTGDEVLGEGETPQPWQLRNSNQAALTTMLGGDLAVEIVTAEHCADDKASLAQALARCLETSDAIVMTGGVSMGDYDYVPDIVRGAGGQVVFHGLPIRPGKPILGAATAAGKLIVGLPGNPVSAVVNARRMVKPLLARIGGRTNWLPSVPGVRLIGDPPPPIPLHRMPLVELVGDGRAELVPARGSGDLVALGKSDGFVEIPPNSVPNEPLPFYAWD